MASKGPAYMAHARTCTRLSPESPAGTEQPAAPGPALQKVVLSSRALTWTSQLQLPTLALKSVPAPPQSLRKGWDLEKSLFSPFSLVDEV